MQLSILLLLLYHIPYNLAYSCDLKPKGASGSPNEVGTKFRIVIVTNPEKYTPGQTYNVILQGRNNVLGHGNQFNGFSLKVEPKNIDEMSPSPGSLAAGLLQIIPGDSNAKIDETCPNMVVHTSHTLVFSIEVLWTAPPPGSDCVVFRASVMEQNIWYQNGGGLTLELCEEDQMKSNDTDEKCCPCNEAKYEMKFEGAWTRQSHPLYFPSNMWLTRFSDVIGASHVADYRFWRVGEKASQGLIEFLEKENTTALESEIKSSETRTVIKAKGLRYPNITGKTFAVFRVDREHHLLSFISLLIPSPDWFVGISGLELCDNKCGWIAEKKLDLYPYDLGLYADLQYMSRNITSLDPITKIDHASIYESPFHTNNTEKLKPLARVYLTRSRIYERNCSNEKPPEDLETSRPGIIYPTSPKLPSELTEKNCLEASSMNSSCSKPDCDLERTRIEFKVLSDEVRQFCIKINVTSIEKLISCPSNCSSTEEKRLSDPYVVKNCELTSWTPFSPCDPNKCIRKRTRKLARKTSLQDKSCRLIFEQQIECSTAECIQNSKFSRKGWRRKSSH